MTTISTPISHSKYAAHLNAKNIGNRMFFGGNLLRQPVFVQLRKDRPESIRCVGSHGATIAPVTSEAISVAFPGAEAIINEAIFLGTYPGLTPAMLAYEIQVIRDFVTAKSAGPKIALSSQLLAHSFHYHARYITPRRGSRLRNFFHL